MRATLYTVPETFPGKISVMARPRGGDWLVDEMKALREAGVEVLVSCLTMNEQIELDLIEEETYCREQEIVYLSLSIIDRSIPPFASQTFEFFEQLNMHVVAGKHVVIHCRQGLGRFVLVAASLLVLHGYTPERAFETLSQIRGYAVPETDEQCMGVMGFWGRKHSVSNKIPR